MIRFMFLLKHKLSLFLRFMFLLQHNLLLFVYLCSDIIINTKK